MKKLQLLMAALIVLLIQGSAFAQTQKTETFEVFGNCGMCKKTIEKAAKDAGASFADWNKSTKKMTVKFKSKKTDLSKIQQKIADAGYDNAGAKASDSSYNNLHGCCQYDRSGKK